MSRLLIELNDAQREAVTTTEGPLLIIAGAGSGKTRVLTRRLAYLVTERLAAPWQILAVTFTNKAAQEMKSRVSELLGLSMNDMYVSTFHSFCSRLLRKEAAWLGYSSTFTIFDDSDQETLMKNCLKELSLSGSQFTHRAQMRKISDAKNKLISPEAFAQNAAGYFESTTARIYSLYQRRLRECDAMDFDDLLFYSVTLLRDNEEVRKQYQSRFKYLMVDEYQDTNHVQYLLLKYLLDDHRNICVVGDEDQSIYGWRGADIRNILEFERDFPGAKIIKLEQNYRSTKIILQAASAVIGNNTARKGKTLRTDQDGGDQIRLMLVNSADDEAAHVIDRIEKEKSINKLNEITILYRTNAQSRPFEEQLRRKNIPYHIVGGIAFYQRKEIKDLLAYLKLLVNKKDDVSFERIINYPKRGIGDKTVEEIAAVARQHQCSMFETVSRIREFPELESKAKKIEPFVQIITNYQAKMQTMLLNTLTQDLVEELQIIPDLLSEDRIIGQTKVENLEAFTEGMSEYVRANPEATLATYLSEISLFSDLDNYSGIEDKVTLMTLHSAKGLEYNSVYLVGLEEGLFPLQRTITEPMELEEERRLFYVGATRAKKRLHLSSATVRHRFGTVESIPSRFIKEVPVELLETLDYRTHRFYEYSSPASVQPTRANRIAAATASSAKSGVHYEYEENETYRTGRIVHHPTFGRGRILATEGYGDSLRLEIAFTGVGVKKLMVKFAKLKVVG